MPPYSRTDQLSVDGETISRAPSGSADNANKYGTGNNPIALPAANLISGANYTNDGDSTATITATAGHTLVTGKADLYWDGGIRYGCDITVSTNDVDLSGGAGDAIPASATPCTLANQVQINVSIDGDAAKAVGVEAKQSGTSTATITTSAHVDFQDADGDSIRAVELLADEPDIWDDAEGRTNPYTGDPITKAMASNGDETTAKTIKILICQDSTP